MITNNYNQKFRNFFEKFYDNYQKTDSKEEKDFLWKLAIIFVEKNRDFVMQYPLVNYWEDVPEKNYEKTKNILLSEYENKNINLYFHIPFCKTKCTYCNFHIITWDKNKDFMQKLYIHKLKYEIDDFLANVKNFSIDSIFIGWWTPSYLDEEYLEDLLWYIKEKLANNFSKNIEFSFEWNPDSINENKLKILKKYYVNRLSIWVQTFDNEILKKINRTYKKETVLEVLKLAKKTWFENINIDMIYGLPGSNYENMKIDLNIVKNLDITHVTYYPLYYYEDSILSKTGKFEDNIELIYNFYDEVTSNLKEKWFTQYWREYFCKNDLIHNYQNNYVSNKLLYGFWHSAYSFNWNTAFYKDQDLKNYLKTLDNIKKVFYYNNENLDRRLFVLWSRNINIKNVNIKNIAPLEKSLKMSVNLNLIKDNLNSYTLTDFWLKYQELVAHLFV